MEYVPDFEIVRPKWERREMERFQRGEYRFVPWENEDFWIAGEAEGGAAFGHFAHASLRDCEMLAYTQTPDKGARDIQTRIKPGKYLRKYFPDLPAHEVERWSNAWAAQFGSVDVHFAATADDIEAVYVGGPRSCMAGEWGGDSSQHPVRAYAHSDLAIAYLGGIEHATARALCWPERKLFGRHYGDDKLELALCRLGYTAGDMSGAKLAKIEDSNGYLMPYLDGYSVDEHSGHFTLEKRGTHGTNQSGLIMAEPENVCEDCRGDAGEDFCSVGDRMLCSDCYCEGYSYCEGCNESYPNDDFTRVHNLRSRGGETYMCDSCAREHPKCGVCDERHVDELIVGEFDGDPLCEDCYGSGDYGRCDDCGDIEASGDITRLESERTTQDLCSACLPDCSERDCCGEVWETGSECNCPDPSPEKWDAPDGFSEACAVILWPAPPLPVQGTVSLAYPGQERADWPAVLYGPLAVHRDRDVHGKVSRAWKVTHRVAGLSICGIIDDADKAHALARLLQSVPEWGEIAADGTMGAEVREKLRVIISDGRVLLGFQY